MSAATIRVGWCARAIPLVPTCVLAQGPAARRLVRRVLTGDAVTQGRLRGVAGTTLVAFEGDSHDLPWVDGAEYFGRDPSAPSLFLPTAVCPDIDVALFERAVRKARPGLVPPVAVLAGGAVALSLAGALPVDRSRLLTWLETTA